MSEPIWQQSVKAAWLGWVVALFIAEFLLFGTLSIFVTPVMWGVMLFLAVLLAAIIACFAVVNIVIDDQGIHVRFGWFDWPKIDVVPAEIESAEVADIRPLRWGGYGYRGSLKMFKRAGVIQRAGPGVRVHLTDGRLLAITVDDPEGAVAALDRVRTPR